MFLLNRVLQCLQLFLEHQLHAFVAMRKYISSNLLNQNYINSLVLENQKMILTDHNLVIENQEKIKALEETFKQFEERKKVNDIYFDGQIYDAYSLLCDILNEARDSIILIDNYLDKSILDVLAKIDKSVFVITKNINQKDLEMYKKQYQNIKIKCDNSFHDRFIIIDKKILYHCGASFKDLGNKCFAITKMEDKEILENLLDKIGG